MTEPTMLNRETALFSNPPGAPKSPRGGLRNLSPWASYGLRFLLLFSENQNISFPQIYSSAILEQLSTFKDDNGLTKYF